MLRDHVSQPRLSGPRSQMLQSSGTDPGSDHGTDHGIRPGAGSDSDFDPQMTVVKKRGSLDPRSFKHMVIAASLLVTLSLLAASIFAYFSAYAPIVESTDTFGQVELDTAVSGKLNDVALPVDDSGSGSGFELAELYSGDVVQFDVTVTNEQNKSAWLAVDIGLQGEAIDVIANGGAATSADIQQYFSIYPTGDMNEVEDLYAAEMADGDSKLTGQTRWRGPLQQGGAYSIFWSEEAKNRVINADSSSTASEDESSVFAAGGAMAGKKIDFLADGAHGNQGTLTYSLHYHPNGALAKLVLDKSLKLSVESYGVQYRNNPNHGMATWDYGYTGVAQLFIAPEDGLYRFEAWGARSGLGYRSNSGLCSNGAYAAGTLEMKAGDEIFVYAGGIGTNALSPKATSFNGGGDAGKDGGSASGGGGGGATDFRLVKSVAADRWSGVESLNSRILVAAGAGGQRDWSSGNVAGVPGGALVSLPGTGQETSQTDGYAFGWGQDGVRGDFPAAGGGGGWYGGKRAWGSAAGGSSFISGYPGSVALDGTDALNAGNPRTHRTDIDSVDKATQVIDGVSYVFTDAEMIAGNVASPRWQNGRDGEKSVGNPGAGHARITALSMERSVTMKFETNGGGVVQSQKLKPWETATKPSDPTKANYEFAGWYTESTFTNAFDFDTPIDADVTLCAKWVLPVLVQTGNSTGFGSGNEVTLFDRKWRILGIKNSNQALVVRTTPLTDVEMGLGTAGTQLQIAFLTAAAGNREDGSGLRSYYYFDSDGSNGYEDSGCDGCGIKDAIDTYFEVASGSYPVDALRVLPVELNSPTLADYFAPTYSGVASQLKPNDGSLTYANWSWADGPTYARDPRFAASVDASGTPQAFAPGLGDIRYIIGGSSTTFEGMRFSNTAPAGAYWLRSPGAAARQAELNWQNAFQNFYHVDGSNEKLLVRPAMWISLGG